jgi:hypothetical protein
LIYAGFDILYFIPSLLIAPFLRLLSSMFVLRKVGGHVAAGKEALKYMQASPH